MLLPSLNACAHDDNTTAAPSPSQRETSRVVKRRLNAAAFATVIQSSMSPTSQSNHNFEDTLTLAPFDAGLQLLVVGNIVELGIAFPHRHGNEDKPSSVKEVALSNDPSRGSFLCTTMLPSDDSLFVSAQHVTL